MKITIDVNGNPTEITLTAEQVAFIEAQNKPKFQWNYPISNTFLLAAHTIDYNYDGDSFQNIESGRYRLTKEVAEQSLLRNKRANRLEALAEQLGGLVSSEAGPNRYYIIFWQDLAKPQAEDLYTVRPETVYMTEKCVFEICRMINSLGGFSLDGEL